jgi:dihydrofolate reductase
MRDVIYSMGVSLDGFIAGPNGDFDWSAPDEELHRFHNQQTRELGAHLCGRRLYEVMTYWETADENPSAAEHELEFARIWKNLPKIVFSRTLTEVEGNARLARDGVAEEVARLRRATGQRPGRGRRRPGLDLHRARPCRRVSAVRQSGRTGRGNTLFSAPGGEDQLGAGGDADVWLSGGLRSLSPRVERPHPAPRERVYCSIVFCCSPERTSTRRGFASAAMGSRSVSTPPS